jgi:hypothetical protein
VTAADQPARPTLQTRVYEATRTGLIVPRLATAAAGRAQTAYRAYLDHAQDCPGCRPRGARCDAAQNLWTAYRGARGTQP